VVGARSFNNIISDQDAQAAAKAAIQQAFRRRNLRGRPGERNGGRTLCTA